MKRKKISYINQWGEKAYRWWRFRAIYRAVKCL